MNNRFFIPLMQHLKSIFFDDDSDYENDKYGVLEKVDNFAEFTVPNMTSKQFHMHFRITPDTFETVLTYMVATQEYNNMKIGATTTLLEKELMVTLWYLSNIESFRSVADRFGISKSTAWEILHRNCQLLLLINQHFKFIYWPNNERQRNISARFNRHGLAGVIGCIDGSHIPITAPKSNHISYINRKNFHSLLLQGVCDDKLLFTDVYAGEAGSLHDYTLFRRSDLYKEIQRGHIEFHEDNFLIGDLAYRLENYLLVGFKNNGRLTRRQKNFNLILNKSRVAIERAFGLLKGRFRRMKMLEAVRLDNAVLLIVSSCILHNICIMNEDEMEMEAERRNNPHNELDITPDEERHNAIQKRNNLVNSLPIIIND